MVVSFESVKWLISELRLTKNVVFTNGCFDGLHIGHVKLLDWCAGRGDILVVAVNDNESIRKLKGVNRPRFDLDDRLFMVSSLKSVDYVFPFCGDISKFVNILKPDFLVKGSEYQGTRIPGKKEVEDWGGEVLFAPMYGNYSSSKLFKETYET